eukprot:scaffold4247_cov66-Cylindrotheca_fusiformis.AAC.12
MRFSKSARLSGKNGALKKLSSIVVGSFLLVLAAVAVHQNRTSLNMAIYMDTGVSAPQKAICREETEVKPPPKPIPVEVLPHVACEKLLDSFDAKFKLRTANRQEMTKKWNDSVDVEEAHAYDLFEPEVGCFDEERFGSKERFGSFGDGPKFVCGVDTIAAKSKTSEGCLVYSVGSNNKIAFEVAVKSFMGCETHTFDPTLRVPFVGDQYATFHPWGVGVDGEENMRKRSKWVSKGIETIMNELGHSNRTLDILKIDCEGCEHVAFPFVFDAIAAGRIKVNQIQVEIHGALYPRVVKFFEAADKAKMRIFHKERNHWGCQGYKCLEYALISEEFLREANKASVCKMTSTG